MTEHDRPKPKILMTRRDHLAINSSPPIAPVFGDDIPYGDTLNDRELADRYANDVKGMQSLLDLPFPEEQKQEMFGGFFEPWPETLVYYRSRGIDTTDGEALLGRTNPKLQSEPKE